MVAMDSSDAVLRFWFTEIDAKQWWTKDAAFDDLIKTRFGAMHERTSKCENADWRATAQGRLAEVIVLDQFSRNIYRDQAAAFACDRLALGLAQEALRAGAATMLSKPQLLFLLMPFMHSESLKIHDVAVEQFRALGLAENLDFEMKHRAIIERFGRYPHRNDILQRASTADEIEFLKLPGSGF